MSTSHSAPDGHDFVSPVSAGTTRPHDGLDNAADAPEVAEVQSPSTAVASPVAAGGAANSPEVAKQYVYNDDNAKEVIHYEAGDKILVPAEHQYTQYPQATADLSASNDDAEKVKENGSASVSGSAPPERRQKNILGMSRKVFFIALAIACIVIAAAVGGGVGATMSKKPSSGDSGKPDGKGSG